MLRLPWLQCSLRQSGGYLALLDGVASVVHACSVLDAPAAHVGSGASIAATFPAKVLFRTLRLSAAALQDADAYALLPAQLLCRMGSLRETPPSFISSLLNGAVPAGQ
jgi:hypothetical protein